MNESVTSHKANPATRHQGHDARLLADCLRTSRVTLLFGEQGVSRTELLTDAVLPLLRRRVGDGPTRSGRKAKASTATAERRIAAKSRPRRSERVVLFNEWGGAPLASLEVSILSSLPMGVVVQAQNHRLADLLAELSDGLDAQFLILLDSFEELWGPDSQADSTLEFLDQLSEAADRKDLSANFLLSVDESAEPRLEALRSRISGFGDSTLRLHAEASRQIGPKPAELPGTLPQALSQASPPLLSLPASLPPVLRAESVRRKRPRRQPLPPPEPIKTETVYAFIASTLTQTADAVEPWQGAEASAAVLRPPGASSSRVLPPSGGGTGASGARPLVEQAMEPHHGRSVPTRFADHHAAPMQPPSPIDEWLDAAASWVRRVFSKR